MAKRNKTVRSLRLDEAFRLLVTLRRTSGAFEKCEPQVRAKSRNQTTLPHAV